jgi:large subunit ribosomal protein L25
VNVKTVFELAVEPRAQVGRAGSRKLRKAGKVPAILYGGGESPESMLVDHNALARKMTDEAFFTSVLTLKIGTKSQQVVVKDVQRHPVKPQIMHLDFQRIREDVEITLSVPVHFLNEAEAKGVKEQGGVVDHLLTEVEVVCLPRYLPKYLEIDVTALELNQLYHLSDIKLPEGVALVDLKRGQDKPLVAVNPPREEEIDVPVEAAEVPAGEVPATAQAAPEAAAEGEEKEKEGGAKDKDKDKDKEAKKADKKEKG